MNSEITLTTSYQKFESVKYLFCGHFIVIFSVRKRIPHYNLEDLPEVLTWISKGVLLETTYNLSNLLVNRSSI